MLCCQRKPGYTVIRPTVDEGRISTDSRYKVQEDHYDHFWPCQIFTFSYPSSMLKIICSARYQSKEGYDWQTI